MRCIDEQKLLIPKIKGYVRSPNHTYPYFLASILDNVAVAFGAWQPHPVGMAPENGAPNENLIGYIPTIERLHSYAMRIFDGVALPNHGGMVGRLKQGQVLVNRVSNVCQRYSDRYRMNNGIPMTKNSLPGVSFVKTDNTPVGEATVNTACLNVLPLTVRSLVPMSTVTVFETAGRICISGMV